MIRNLLLWSTGTVVVDLDNGSTRRSRNITCLLTVIHVALEDLTFTDENVQQVVLLLNERGSFTLLPPVQLALNRLLKKLEDSIVDGYLGGYFGRRKKLGCRKPLGQDSRHHRVN